MRNLCHPCFVVDSELSPMVMLPVFVPNLSQPKSLSGEMQRPFKSFRSYLIMGIDMRSLH